MGMVTPTLRDLTDDAKRALKTASPLIKLLARIGYAAKGSIYLLIGVTAILIAFGRGSQTPDFSGVIIQVFQQPFGNFLLALLTFGLIGYSLGMYMLFLSWKRRIDPI